MAPDQRPMTEEEIDALQDAIAELREEVLEDLPTDFGGSPDDYAAESVISDREH